MPAKNALDDLIFISRVFDHVVLESTPDDLDILLYKLQTSKKRSSIRMARLGWLLARAGRIEEAVAVLKRYPNCMLCKGYLSRIKVLLIETDQEREKQLQELQSLDVDLGTHTANLEGLMHMNYTCAMQLTTLGRYEEAERYLLLVLEDAARLKMRSMVPNAEYELSRVLYVQKRYEELIRVSLGIMLNPDASDRVRFAAGDQLLWCCVYLGCPVPETAPEWVHRAHKTIVESAPAGEVPSWEWKLVAQSWQLLLELTDLVHREFPVSKAKQFQEQHDTLLQSILDIKEDPNINYTANVFLCLSRTLALAVTFDERCKDELERLKQKDLAGIVVLECFRAFAVMQVEIYLRNPAGAKQAAVQVIDLWRACTADQQKVLVRFVYDLAPSVVLALDRFLDLPRMPLNIANITEKGMFLQGVKLTDTKRSYPVKAVKKYFEAQSSGQAEFSESKQFEHAYFVHKYEIHRVNFEMVSGSLLTLFA